MTFAARSEIAAVSLDLQQLWLLKQCRERARIIQAEVFSVGAVAHCAQSRTQARDRRSGCTCVEIAALSAGLHELVVF